MNLANAVSGEMRAQRVPSIPSLRPFGSMSDLTNQNDRFNFPLVWEP